MSRCLRYRFRTERLQLKTLAGLRLKGATVLDIGANKGIYSYWLARAVGPSGNVVAFEPQPEMARYIDDRKRTFKLVNVRVMNTALSKEPGTATLTRARVGDGSASLEPSRLQVDQLNVPLTTLDSMCIPNLRFIKCDVEGHEMNVFSGAELTLRALRPIVQFEALPAETAKLFSFFEALGYSGVMFLGNRYLPCSNPDRVEHYKFGLEGHRDYLFFPPEAIGSTIPPSIYRQFPK
ncbi:FkbM family methyltransferase [Bradyrhizobium sp. 4]|nr:FkbM family methyltransferase [Bradyrhizobium sp. 39]MCK1751266.1 FkbM family methyltransferase [Bradyrhizobium sp. 135]UPJ38797.1 FkbM family methyltransferase [Bradyrhizobium sp. 4]